MPNLQLHSYCSMLSMDKAPVRHLPPHCIAALKPLISAESVLRASGWMRAQTPASHAAWPIVPNARRTQFATRACRAMVWLTRKATRITNLQVHAMRVPSKTPTVAHGASPNVCLASLQKIGASACSCCWACRAADWHTCRHPAYICLLRSRWAA